MAWRKIDDTKLTAIADAIRGKTGGTDALTLDDMPAAIASIQTGGGGSFETCNVTLKYCSEKISYTNANGEVVTKDINDGETFVVAKNTIFFVYAFFAGGPYTTGGVVVVDDTYGYVCYATADGTFEDAG